MHYEILIIHFCIFILTDPNKFQLKDCVEDKEANTSLCLLWENEDSYYRYFSLLILLNERFFKLYSAL